MTRKTLWAAGAGGVTVVALLVWAFAPRPVQVELARAAVFAAARAVDEMRSDEEIAKHVSRAKARAGDMAMLVTRQAIQLHGGIGFADESDIGLYLRRAMVLVNQGGSPAWHRKRYGALIAA